MTTDNELDAMLEEYKTHILLVHRDAPNTLEGQTAYFSRGKKQAKLALTRLIEAEKVKARIEETNNLIEWTKLPIISRDCDSATLRIVQIAAEKRLAQLSHPKERTEG